MAHRGKEVFPYPRNGREEIAETYIKNGVSVVNTVQWLVCNSHVCGAMR